MMPRTIVPLCVGALAALTLFFAVLSGCNFQNPVEDFHLIMNTPQMSTTVTIQFQDAFTGDLIMTQAVDVTVVGEDANKIADFGFEPMTDFQAVGGVGSFTLVDGVIPSNDEPIDIRLVIHSDDYLSTSLPIHIIAPSTYPYRVELVSISRAPAGVALASMESGECGPSGTVTERVQLETETSDEVPTTVTVNVSEGTRINDRFNNPLRGKLTAFAAYFNPMDEDVLPLFPGGLAASTKSLDGTVEEQYFTTAGFVEVQISDEDGRIAKSFSNGGVTVDMEVDPDLLNPETGVPVQAGDTIPYWSYSEETGEWTEEGLVTLTGPNPNGFLVGSMVTSHLTNLNMDWADKGTEFYIGFINWQGIGVWMELLTQSYGSRSFALLDEFNYIYNVVSDVPIRFRGTYTDSLFLDSMIVPPQETSPPDTLWFTLPDPPDDWDPDDHPGPPPPPPPTPYDAGGSRVINISADLECFDENEYNPYLSLRPSMPVFIKEKNLTGWNWAGDMSDGLYTFSTAQPDSFYIFMFAHEQARPTYVTVKAADETSNVNYKVHLSREFCDGADENENTALYEGEFNLVSRSAGGQDAMDRPLIYNFDPNGFGSWVSIDSEGGLAWYTGGTDMVIVRMPETTMFGSYSLIGDQLTFSYKDTDGKAIVERFER